MEDNMQLRIPGPTPCPPEVLKAMGFQMINHRGKEFAELLHNITAKLKQLFQTENDLYILTTSGTGSLEAAVVNMLSPGDKVLSASIGVFGDRFASIAETFGAEVKRLNFEWGKAIDPDVLRKALKDSPDVKAVLVTHNETSTGVTNDLETVSSVIKEFDKLILVDAISSLGCIDLKVDAWRCDVVVTGSQKGWMVPPGLAMVSLNDNAWKAHAEAKMPRFYFDFSKAKSYLEKGQTPWTPAISIFFALGVALDMLLAEGLQNIFDRHARVARFVRDGVKANGLNLFADEKYASNTVTSVKAESFDPAKLLALLQNEHDVVLTGGQTSLAGKIFRIGHLGWVTEDDMRQVLEALAKVLPKVRS
jgi:aspartate aminotransferase-like enzyme